MRSLLLLSFLIWTLLSSEHAVGQIINDRRWHLGRFGIPEWDEFAKSPPDAERLDLVFEARANEQEATLFIRQDDVRREWPVELNGRRIGMLFPMEQDLVSSLSVPAGTLRDGENELAIIPPDTADDIVLVRIRLKPGGPAEAIDEARLDVSVVDSDTGDPLPARITVVDLNGTLVPLVATKDDPGRPVAVRPGVAYVGPAGAMLGLPVGDYTVYASRGFEYSVSSLAIHPPFAGSTNVRLSIRREVPMPGWVNCDTHVHTRTYSGHGDASLNERMLTLAGEGVELPVATEHNLNADYREAATQTGVSEFFTPVVGNEVTTRTAHFNVFPVRPGARGPDFRIGDWAELLADMRSTPDVRVVVLNHPLNIHNGFQPFSPTLFNNVTGESLNGAEYSFDAIELLNSSAQQSDFMAVYRGWFALLNHGHRITGVGSSDCHDVSRYIVGQGRTYIPCPDADPANIDLGRACDSLLAGRALVSMGLLVDLKVGDRFRVGDLATGLTEHVEVTATVFGPSWVEATNVTFFANGRPVIQKTLTDTKGKAGEKSVVRWTMTKPPHDVHLVAIATGPEVTGPFWAMPRPYQPASKKWTGHVIGSTNPIRLDADGDGRFTSARDYARLAFARHGTNPEKFLESLGRFDEAVAAQAASLLSADDVDPHGDRVQKTLKNSPEAVRRGFESFLKAKAASGIEHGQ